MKSILVTVALLASQVSCLRLLDTPSNQTAPTKVITKSTNSTNTTNTTNTNSANAATSLSQANYTVSNYSLGNLTWGNQTALTNNTKNTTDIPSLIVDVLNALNQTLINVTTDLNSTDTTEDDYQIEPLNNTTTA